MRNHPLSSVIEGYFRSRSLRTRITLFQLPLPLAVALVLAACAVFRPEPLWDPLFQATLLPHLLLLICCVVMPWDRLPASSVVVIPFLDCLAVGFSREAGGQNLSVLGIVLVFPVVWISVGGNQGRVVLAIVATILSMVLPPIAIGEGFDPSLMIRAILVTVVMATIALTAHVVARQVVQQRQALERHDKNLAALLQESEQRQQLLDTVVETVSVGVRVVDPDGGSILVNRRYRAAVARANDDETEAADAGMLQLLAGDRATPIDPDRSPVRRAAAGETISEELYWAGTGKSQRAFSVAARQMSSRNGAFTGSVLSFADVTSLVTALAAKDEFVTTMSHEVRTPLTSIFGYLEMLMDEPGNAGIRDDLAVIARNAERLLVLLDNLMAAGSDGADLKWAEADLGQIIEDAAALVAPDANAAGLDLVMDLRRPVKAAFDPERVSQVLHNLLSNAIKYSPDGGVISINAHRDGQEVVCTISDRGIGMRPEEVEQAFTKFFRAGHARESSIPGAGLGLPISKSIIERHGGTISLNSHPGKGTTVKFTLPANLADAN